MKLTTTLALTLLTLVATAQTDIVLEIDHMLGTAPMAPTTNAVNNNGEEFEVTRLEYYISEITLIHDGGQVTPVPSKYILANAYEGTSEALGSFNIINLEAVEFGIGVDPSVNHLDPAQYDANDPLAPQSPSMHWGWAPGYRFVAMEGASGVQMSQNYEVHALGDDNYFKQTIPTAGVVNGNTLTVKLIGNYEQAMRDISVASGPIVHGENGIAEDLLLNFKLNVFTSIEGNGPVGVNEVEQPRLVVYPNPTNGFTQVSLVDLFGNGELRIVNAAGELVQSLSVIGGRTVDVDLSAAGVYQVALFQAGRLISTQSVVRK